MKGYQISISNPCSQDWNNMQDHPSGKFCFSCNKEVKDFTGMKDQEILAYLLHHGNVCGKLLNTQLNKTIYYQRPIKSKKYHWPSIAALLVAGFFSIAPAFSQQPTTQKLYDRSLLKAKGDEKKREPEIKKDEHLVIPQLPVIAKDSSMAKKKINKSDSLLVIKGTVTEIDNKEPIPFATIIVEKNGQLIKGVSADIDGSFQLTIAKSSDELTITARAVGYTQQKLVINTNTWNANKEMRLELDAPRMGMMGYVVVKTNITINPGNAGENTNYGRDKIMKAP